MLGVSDVVPRGGQETSGGGTSGWSAMVGVVARWCVVAITRRALSVVRGFAVRTKRASLRR